MKLMAILSQLAENKQLKASARSITKGDSLHDDLFQHALLKIYDLGEDRVVEIARDGSIEGYMNVIMHRNWTDNSSTFNRLHRPPIALPEDHSPTESRPITKKEIAICLEYFDGVSPERVVVAMQLEKLTRKNKRRKRFDLPSVLVKWYIENGGVVSTLSHKIGIEERALRYQFKIIFDQIREGITNK